MRMNNPCDGVPTGNFLRSFIVRASKSKLKIEKPFDGKKKRGYLIVHSTNKFKIFGFGSKYI